MLNWGNWMRAREDGGLGYGQSVLAGMLGTRVQADASNSIPFDEVEASKTDEAVRSIEPQLRQFAMAWYVKGWSTRDISRKLSCSTATVPVRLEAVRRAVAIYLSRRAESRQRAEKCSLNA